MLSLIYVQQKIWKLWGSLFVFVPRWHIIFCGTAVKRFT